MIFHYNFIRLIIALAGILMVYKNRNNRETTSWTVAGWLITIIFVPYVVADFLLFFGFCQP